MLLRHDGGEQCPRDRRGLEAQLAAQYLPTGLVLADRFARVPLLQVGPDEHAMGTLAERLTGHSRKARLDRLAVPPSRRKLPAQPLEGIKTLLTEALALDQQRKRASSSSPFSLRCRDRQASSQ